jgi:transposase
MAMKYCSEEIIERAEEALKKSKDSGVFKRAMAVLLMARDGYSPGEASRIMNVSISTLTRYRKEFGEGTYNLPKEPKTGNSSYLTWEEEEGILQRLKDKMKNGELTTISVIKEEYEKVAGFIVGKSTIYRFLERHEWRKVQPRPRHSKTNLEAQEEFKKNCRRPCKI